MARARKPKPESGYSYVYYQEFGEPGWAGARDENWETELIREFGRTIYLGTRMIDGVRVVVWERLPKKERSGTTKTVYFAQTAVGPRYVP